MILCRMRTGHTHGTHGHPLCGAGYPACPRCRHVVSLMWSVRHVLLECPLLEEERRQYLGASAIDLSLSGLLGDDSRCIDDGRLFSFIDAARLSVINTLS